MKYIFSDKYMVAIAFVLGWFWVILSFCIENLVFQDSGSILVMFCVLNEFYFQRLERIEKIIIDYKFKLVNTYSIAIGTLIWGYGSFLEKKEFFDYFWVFFLIILFFLFYVYKYVIINDKFTK